jgi:aldehyde:ferredoxin oxidoreductase
MKWKGYMGKILTVDLSTGEIGHMPLDDETVELYIGGRGLATRILYDAIEPGIDPLSPENKVLFITGPSTGTLVPTTSRFGVGTKSPLNNTLSVSYAGGFLAPEIKFAGYDGILISGASETPVYLYIFNDQVEIRDASHLWGKDALEAQEALKEELGPEFQLAAIGPAGENLVPMAATAHEQHIAGRGGDGAVLGFKKLKALAVRGTGSVEVALPSDEFLKEARSLHETILGNPVRGAFREFGTTGMLGAVNEAGALPTRNFQETRFEGGDKLLGEVLKEYVIRSEACSDCPICCCSVVEVEIGDETYQRKFLTERLEHQPICALGTFCGIDDIEALIVANDVCDRMGIDAISAGATIAFAMELYQRGILTKEQCDGLDLTWGHADVLVPLIRKMAYREPGIGALLSQGSRQAAEEIGGDAGQYAMHSKGLEMSGYDPRGFTGMALNLATTGRGADHNKAFTIAAEFLGILGDHDRFDTGPKPLLTKTMQDSTVIIDSIIMCMFTVDLGISVELYGKAISIVTGMDIDAGKVYEIGERVNNLERMWNIREGMDGAYDTLPERMATLPDATGHTVDVAEMLPEYYRLRGWDERGVPTPERLAQLKIRV